MLDKLRTVLPEGHDDLIAEVEATLARLEALSAERDDLAARHQAMAAEHDAMTAERDRVIAEAEAASRDAGERLAATATREAVLTARYLSAVKTANPDLPEELVAGDTFEAIDAAVVSAKAVVAKVAERVRTEIAARTVPNGAPARTGPDLETMTAREKIALGLRRGVGG